MVRNVNLILSCDDRLMQERAEQIIDGVRLMLA